MTYTSLEQVPKEDRPWYCSCHLTMHPVPTLARDCEAKTAKLLKEDSA